MSAEQTDFFDKLGGDQKEQDNVEEVEKDLENNKGESEIKPERVMQEPDDGLGSKCEYCSDSPGGCRYCGFGKDR